MSDSRDLAELLARAHFTDNMIIRDAKLEIGEKGLELSYKVEYNGIWEVIGSRRIQYERLWADPVRIRDAQVAAAMVRQGYVLVTVPGGMIVVSPENEEYQLHEDTCTCMDFLKKKHKCKHLMFRDWFQDHRRRAVEYREKLSQENP